MTLLNILNSCSISDLLRAYNSDKDYLSFKVSVFNVGANVQIICTDQYKQINYNYWNGYDSTHQNDCLVKHFIYNVLLERANNKRKEWTDKQLKRFKAILNTL